MHATLPIAIVSDFEFTFLPKKFERIARNMDTCLRVLKEATKVGSTAAIVGNSVLVLSYPISVNSLSLLLCHSSSNFNISIYIDQSFGLIFVSKYLSTFFAALEVECAFPPHPLAYFLIFGHLLRTPDN